MPRLINLSDVSEENLNNILDGEIICFEDIQGSKIYVNWNGSNFTIKPKSISSSPINMIDLAMQNYYNLAITYLESLPDRVKSLLNKKWWFGFEYFPDEQPANISYSRTPKNNLVLCSIAKGDKFSYTIEEIEEYARLMDVDMVPIIFKGKLSEENKKSIKYFLATSEADLEYVFGENSFSYFFYKLLSPNERNSFLMSDEFQKNVEKIILKSSKDNEISFSILNPLYKKISENNITEFVEIYTLILVNFLTFCQTLNLREIKVNGENKEECYIHLICKLFNVYLSKVKSDLLDFDFIVPEFFDKDKFRINLALIPNELTKRYIKENKKIEYIFKVILGSFNKKRKKPIGILTEPTIVVFNNFVDHIHKRINLSLNKKSETDIIRSGLVDFGEFFDIKSSYDKDGEGKSYPDIYKEIERNRDKESMDSKSGEKGKVITGSEKNLLK